MGKGYSDNIKNPHQFKFINNKLDDCGNGIIRVGMASNSGQTYAALVDVSINPITKIPANRCFIEYCDLSGTAMSGAYTYRAINNDQEWNAASDYFRRVGVFENFFKFRNWMFKTKGNVREIPEWLQKQYPWLNDVIEEENKKSEYLKSKLVKMP